mgnify:CR=1 FL=1
MTEERFNFEDLDVWNDAVYFADVCIDMAERITTPRKHYRLLEQIESASTSVALNIAERKGRYSRKEFVHFLHIARGSLFETVTLLTIFKNRKWIKPEAYQAVKKYAVKLGKRINALITAINKSSIKSQ